MPGPSEGFRFEEKEGVYVITLSRPEKLNPLSSTLLEGLATKLSELAGQPRTLLLAAEGRVFSAGIDLEEVASANTPEEASKPFKALGRAIRSLLAYPAPTLAYIHAPAIAGGAELALAADIIVVGPRGRLEWPEVKWNIVPPLLLALASRTPLTILSAAAVHARRITGEEALRLGVAAYSVESLEDAVALAAGVQKLYDTNREAFNVMLPRLRSWKIKAVEEEIPELERLAMSMELVERARRFLKKA